MAAPWHDSSAYKRFWQLAWYAASTTSTATGGLYTSADTVAAAASIGRAEANPISFEDGQTIAQMYGAARSIERASDAITSAADESAIEAHMISEPPWAGSLSLQTTVPMWQARALITYTDPQGLEIQAWRTVYIPQVLPSTVGGLRDLMASRYQDMLRTQTTKSPSVGTLTSIGKTYLMSV